MPVVKSCKLSSSAVFLVVLHSAYVLLSMMMFTELSQVGLSRWSKEMMQVYFCCCFGS